MGEEFIGSFSIPYLDNSEIRRALGLLPVPIASVAVMMPTIKKVIFHDPATIIIWRDGTKTVVKCGENDTYDREKGMAMAICKRLYGNKGNYNNIFKEWLEEE